MSRRCSRHVRGPLRVSPVAPEAIEVPESFLFDCLFPISTFAPLLRRGVGAVLGV